MSKFIFSVVKICFNGVSFDAYENSNGTATIRPTKNYVDMPKKYWKKFDSVLALKEWLEPKYDIYSDIELIEELYSLLVSPIDESESYNRHHRKMTSY